MRKMNKEITLQTYDDIMGVKENLDNSIDKVIEIPLSQLINFENHPFHVKDNEEMKEMTTSIQERGILCPIIVRPKNNGVYEIVAGHRRKRGCELAGKSAIPCYVRNYTDDEAIIVMVDSNIQRENILISEKAFAYKLKMVALKHQGVRQGEKETADLVGEKTLESGRTVAIYTAYSTITRAAQFSRYGEDKSKCRSTIILFERRGTTMDRSLSNKE